MVEIKMTNGQPVLIDDEDSDLAQVNWYAHHDGYAYRHAGPKWKRYKYFMHKVILQRAIGRNLVEGEFCDHINRAKTDNRRSNLRVATKADNMRNKGLQKNNKVGYKGVCFRKDGSRQKRWVAQISFNGKVIQLGLFATPEEAAKRYDEAAREYHGEFAYQNFPKELPRNT